MYLLNRPPQDTRTRFNSGTCVVGRQRGGYNGGWHGAALHIRRRSEDIFVGLVLGGRRRGTIIIMPRARARPRTIRVRCIHAPVIRPHLRRGSRSRYVLSLVGCLSLCPFFPLAYSIQAMPYTVRRRPSSRICRGAIR